jgi:hypothetical protein
LARKGDHWAWDVAVPALAAKSCGMELFADLTRGKREVVAMTVPDRMDVQAWGEPVVDGVAAGNVIPVRSITPHSVIRKGKWLSLLQAGQRYLYLVAEEVVADGDGSVDVQVTTLLRRPTVDGAVVELAVPMVEGFVEFGQGASLSTLGALGLQFTVEERD